MLLFAGKAFDIALYRASAHALRTNASFEVGGSFSALVLRALLL